MTDGEFYIIMMAVIIAILLIIQLFKWRFPKRPSEHGTARLMTLWEAIRLRIFWPFPRGILVGDWKRYLLLPVYYRGASNGLLCGPPGTGKGLTIISNLVRYAWAFVLDPDGENTAGCKDEWARRGYKVDIVDGSKTSAAVNPCGRDYLNSKAAEYSDRCVFLARLMGTTGLNERDPFFPQKAEAFIAGFIGHMAATEPEDRCNLIVLRSYVTAGAVEFDHLVRAMSRSRHSFVAAVGNEINRMQKQGASKTLDSIMSTVERMTFFLESEFARNALGRTSMRLEDQKGTDAQGRRLRGCIQSLVVPVSMMADQAPTIALIMGCAILSATTGKRPKHQILWVVDEFPLLGKFVALVNFLAISRKYRIWVLLVIQNIGQMKDNYGPNGFTKIESGCQLQQYYQPRDNETADHISHKLGNTTIMSKNQRSSMRPLLTGDEVQRLGDRKAITFLGTKGNRAACLGIRPYWERPMLRFRAGANPFHGRTPMLRASLPFEAVAGLLVRVIGWILGPSNTAIACALMLAVWLWAPELPRLAVAAACQTAMAATGADLCAGRLGR